ncbi:hypothetical protein BO71DRAFT_485066 [Aspergillus ellipticus CBS 707.79]|uniref:Uncharacterized protein n=1 Tax=Aspergillus ellipticus CBS 707.79 TaxID=1448320 RepID=A0A319D6M3_9EURO|nr:hypothetical protein BO71DRAFT_485066 [Aspergillus ellipticus CBS 707.79]
MRMILGDPVAQARREIDPVAVSHYDGVPRVLADRLGTRLDASLTKGGPYSIAASTLRSKQAITTSNGHRYGATGAATATKLLFYGQISSFHTKGDNAVIALPRAAEGSSSLLQSFDTSTRGELDFRNVPQWQAIIHKGLGGDRQSPEVCLWLAFISAPSTQHNSGLRPSYGVRSGSVSLKAANPGKTFACRPPIGAGARRFSLVPVPTANRRHKVPAKPVKGQQDGQGWTRTGAVEPQHALPLHPMAAVGYIAPSADGGSMDISYPTPSLCDSIRVGGWDTHGIYGQAYWLILPSLFPVRYVLDIDKFPARGSDEFFSGLGRATYAWAPVGILVQARVPVGSPSPMICSANGVIGHYWRMRIGTGARSQFSPGHAVRNIDSRVRDGEMVRTLPMGAG